MYSLTAEASEVFRAGALVALLGAGLGLPTLAFGEGTATPPVCRLDNAGATRVAEAMTAAARAYVLNP